eukprot:scaffold654134_cov59-Prasinocladus_malaysianus.AAC.1
MQLFTRGVAAHGYCLPCPASRSPSASDGANDADLRVRIRPFPEERRSPVRVKPCCTKGQIQPTTVKVSEVNMKNNFRELAIQRCSLLITGLSRNRSQYPRPHPSSRG